MFQTWERRNYVFVAVESLHVFFELKKSGAKENRHSVLRVESAYRLATSSYAPPRRLNAIRFAMLVQTVFLERAVRFAPR